VAVWGNFMKQGKLSHTGEEREREREREKKKKKLQTPGKYSFPN